MDTPGDRILMNVNVPPGGGENLTLNIYQEFEECKSDKKVFDFKVREDYISHLKYPGPLAGWFICSIFANPITIHFQIVYRRRTMSMMKEFKEFAMRGNVVDMAVGIIIGAAFGKIVTSLVGDVVMPPIGLLLGGVDFSGLSVCLKEASGAAPAVQLKYGIFINTIIDFVIVAFAIFMLIRGLNSFRKKEAGPAPAPTAKECPECMMTIPLNAKRCGHCSTVLR